MTTKRLKRPRDPVQLGKLIVDIATGQVEDKIEDGKDPVAVARGRRDSDAVKIASSGQAVVKNSAEMPRNNAPSNPVPETSHSTAVQASETDQREDTTARGL